MRSLPFLLIASFVLVLMAAEANADKEPKWSYSAELWTSSVAISADGEYVVAGSYFPHNIYLFNKDSSTPLWSYSTENMVNSVANSVAISADGEMIAAGSDKVYLFDRNSSTPRWSYLADGNVNSVSISADGEYIAATSNAYFNSDCKIYLFDKDSSTPLWSYTTGKSVDSVAISANGEYIVASTGWNDDYNNIYLFDKNSNTPLWNYTTTAYVSSVAISADGEHIVAGLYRNITLFNKNSSTPLWSYSTEYMVRSVAISADGEYVVAGGSKYNIYLFDKDSNTPLWSYETGNEVVSVAISADGEYVVAGTDYNDKCYSFEKNSGTPLWSYDTGGGLDSVAISADGEYVIVGSWDNYLNNQNIWFFDNIIPPTATIDSIFPSPAGKYENITFRGHGTDEDGNITGFFWTSSIDGNLSTEANFSIRVLSLGHHNITFRVQDNDGFWSLSQSTSLWIYAVPVALANDITLFLDWNDEAPKNKVKPGDEVTFKGGGNDEDGEIVLYEWDFNGDGTFDWSSEKAGSTTFVYNNEGTYIAVFQVTDNDGFTTTDSRVITVSSEDEEPLAGQCTCPDGSKGQMVGPADDDGVDDGCLCAISEEDSSLPSISLIPALITIGIIALRRRY